MADTPNQELDHSPKKNITASKSPKPPKSSFSSLTPEEMSHHTAVQASPPEMKTPLKPMHPNEKYTFAKQSLKKTEPIATVPLKDSENTEVKPKADFRTLQTDHNETETRKYYRLIGSGEAGASETRNILKIKFSSQLSQPRETTSIQGLFFSQETSKRNSQKTTPRTVIMKKQRSRVFDRTPEYVPNKKVKKDSGFYKDTLEVFDKLKSQHVKFRLFKDKDLGYSKAIQNTVRVSKVDDDCPTDSEQMELAKKHVQKQLRQAIEMQEFWNSKTSSFSSTSRFSSYEPSQGISSYVPSSSFGTDPFSKSELSEDVINPSQEFGSVVKRLSYSQAKDSADQEKNDFEPPEPK